MLRHKSEKDISRDSVNISGKCEVTREWSDGRGRELVEMEEVAVSEMESQWVTWLQFEFSE
jgi:hypothetical protein